MNNNIAIKTTKIIYPQIYAYVLTKVADKNGWVKIGYTTRKDVDKRIREQTHTAAFNQEYSKLWSEPAKFSNSDEWFKDQKLHAYLLKFKNIKREPKTEWFYYNGDSRDKSLSDFKDFINRIYDSSKVDNQLEYQLRAEQKDAVKKTHAYAKSHPNGEFLWNAKPRFGKTLTAYDLAIKMNAAKVLIVTNRPSIAHSWFDDFQNFIASKTKYSFISTTESLKEHPVLTYEDFLSKQKNNPDSGQFITFISLQDLKGAISFGGEFDKLNWVKELKWELLIIDEAHEGVDTFKTDSAFSNITRNFTLHLSGTPFKAIALNKFSDNQIFNWSYADEQEAKENWSELEQENPYENLPRLNLFSYQMSQMIASKINEGAIIDNKNIDFAFDLNEFFETNNKGKFIHQTEVINWLDTLSKNEKYPFSTQELRNELKHTFWLLNRVASAKALAKILKTHPVFKDYEIILAAGDGKTEDEPLVNDESLERVRKAIKEHPKTITLSVRQLTTGVTVPEWTAVLMLSNMKTPSLYMQAAFRVQNPWDYEANGKMHQKENAYVFDFAPERTLEIYDDFANNLNKKTADNSGTDEHKTNIKTLLNFFPVIAEDVEGKMVELDVEQVLTIPKTIKVNEVVCRGFMSNVLFKNISGILEQPEALAILELINPVDQGRVRQRQTSKKSVNKPKGPSIIISEPRSPFGPKVYADIQSTVKKAIDDDVNNLSNVVKTIFKQKTQDAINVAKGNTVTKSQAEQSIEQNANIIARKVEVIQKQVKIKQDEAKVEFDRQVAVAQDNQEAVAKAKAKFDATTQQIQEDFKKDVVSKVKEKAKELSHKAAEEILKKSDEKKKDCFAVDVRARLRGFARTIPSFLMAYGTSDTNLSNFGDNIKPKVFREVTGITLNQFRDLRDKHNFFDNVVFDESVKEFLHKKDQLANYFDNTQTENIFDYIPPQKNNQIYTPQEVVKLMIDKLKEENPAIFTDKDKTFADLYVKSGLYMAEIIKRLYVGLKNQIPDDAQRLQHILEKQVYGYAPSEIIYTIAKNFVYGGFSNIDTSNLKCLDLTKTAKNGGNLKMKFDAVVGNPPYQETNENRNRDDAIYPYFYDLAKEIAERYVLISPARFLFNVGSTSEEWNQKMLSDKHIKVLDFNQHSNQVFPNTKLEGGVVILYRDANRILGPIETFMSFPELNSILKKVTSLTGYENNFGDLMYVQTKFNLKNLYSDFPKFKTRLGSGGKERRLVSSIFETLPEIFFDRKQSKNFVQIYGRPNNKRVYKWIDKKYLDLESGGNFNVFKVFVPAANGSGAIGEVLSTPIIGEPIVGESFVGHTQTFISIGCFDNRYEADALLKYLKTKFARTMLGIKKTTQNNKTKSTWSKVPRQDFTSKSDIDWTKPIPDIDKQLYAKYKLTKEEIAFIESKISAMD